MAPDATPRVHTVEAFQVYMAQEKPCVLVGGIEADGWTPERIERAVGSEEEVEVADGLEESSGCTRKIKMPLSRYLREMVKPGCGLYLKQNSLILKRCPELLQTVAPVRSLLTGQFDQTVFFWMVLSAQSSASDLI